MKQGLSQGACQVLNFNKRLKNNGLEPEEGVWFCGDCVDTRGVAGPSPHHCIIENGAGVRPGSRGSFLSGKGPKTIDAAPGLIECDERER